jgi:hypothetical protein
MTEFARMDSAIPEDLPFELTSLSTAANYQKWIADSVTPFLGQRILEIGAGIGNLSKWLPLKERLVLTEADSRLLPRLSEVAEKAFGGDPRVTIEHVDLSSDWVSKLASEEIDTVVSFNVLEHIEDDQRGYQDFIRLLSQTSAVRGKRRIVSFVPAHSWAFGSLDRKFGHYRRYERSDFMRLQTSAPVGTRSYFRYFNILGLPSWFIMGRILNRDEIGLGAVSAFEKLCPWVRGLDDLLHVRLRVPFGQSMLHVLEF